LFQHKYIVAKAENGVKALEYVNENEPDLIISDYHLSGTLSGLELIRSLRARQQRHCPAILMSGDTSAALRGLQDPADVVLLAKPIPPDLLLQNVRQLLSP
jgi:CheY-like chemotaxis protein